MKDGKKVRALALIASVLALAMGCVYPIVFIKWIVPLYAVCVAALAAGCLEAASTRCESRCARSSLTNSSVHSSH